MSKAEVKSVNECTELLGGMDAVVDLVERVDAEDETAELLHELAMKVISYYDEIGEYRPYSPDEPEPHVGTAEWLSQAAYALGIEHARDVGHAAAEEIMAHAEAGRMLSLPLVAAIIDRRIAERNAKD